YHHHAHTHQQDIVMEWIEVVKDLHAGTIGGVAGIVAGHPLDTIKVMLQTEKSTSHLGIVGTCRNLAASEGFRGFYKGMLSPILSNAPINAVVFAVYGQTSRLWQDGNSDAKLTPGQQFLAGAAAGLCQVTFAAPAELIKITMQVHNYPSNYSSLTCLRDVFKAEGLRGIYRGTGLQIMRDVPAFGSYFYSYEVLKDALTGGQPDNVRVYLFTVVETLSILLRILICSYSFHFNETTMNLLLAGGLAGSISWMLTHPIDMVKTLVQSQGTDRVSMWDVVRRQHALEGPKFLLKGFGATILRAFPVSAVTFLVYERTMQSLNAAEFDLLVQ
ncbi:hypothetical protein B5M09_007057, partial [Aphanomyces astaci]